MPGLASNDTATRGCSPFSVPLGRKGVSPDFHVDLDVYYKLPGIVNSGARVIGNRKSVGTPTGVKRLLKYSWTSIHSNTERDRVHVASPRYLGDIPLPVHF